MVTRLASVSYVAAWLGRALGHITWFKSPDTAGGLEECLLFFSAPPAVCPVDIFSDYVQSWI